MSRKKPGRKPRPATLSWEFDPDIPTHDFFKDMPLNDPWNLEQAVERFVYWMEEDRFLIWEGIMREEQGIRLTARQERLVGELLNFTDDEEDVGVLYINEIPRPSEPWYVILNKIVPYLLLEPYRTFDVQEDRSESACGPSVVHVTRCCA